MTWLDIIIIVTWVIFIIFSIDLYQRKKFTLLHFVVFWWGTAATIFFSRFPWSLDAFGNLFGLARWADLVVYLSIIFLWYWYVEIINLLTKQSNELSNFVSAEAVNNKYKSMWHETNIWFLIRAYNEEETIKEVIVEIIQKWYTYILICNDWSSDATWEIIEKLSVEYSSLTTIVHLRHLINRGPWAANKTLFSYVKKNSTRIKEIYWRITYDADWQMNIDDMDIFEANMSNDVDIILWSRHITGWESLWIPLSRKIILSLSKIFTLMTTWRRFSDPHNWFRAISSETLLKLDIQSDNMTYASELLSELLRLNSTIREVPVSIRYTEHSLNKWQKNSNWLKIVRELLYKWWFYK